MNTLRAFGSRIAVLITLLGCVSVGVPSAGAALAQPQYITLPGDQSGVAVARSGLVFANEAANGSFDLWYKPFGGVALAVDSSPQNQLSAACSGDTVVYVDKADATGDPTGETNRIMVRDLATQKWGVVSDSVGLKGNPSIHGNTVVWSEGPIGQGDVMTANLDADSDGVKDFLNLVPLPRSVCTTAVGGPGEQRDPKISASGLVWVQYDGTTATAVKRRSVPTNLATEETLSGDTGFKKPSPGISGDLVVWQQMKEGAHLIAVRRISTGVTSYVGGSGGNLGPVTDGERVAWISLQTVVPQVMMSSGGQTLLVAPSPRDQASPRFGDDQLAWEEDMLPGDLTNLDIAYVSLASSGSATTLISAGPSVTISYGADYSFTGRLESQTTPLSGMRIDLEKSTDGSTFLPVPASATTATDGTFTFGGMRPTSKTWYRAVFSGTTEYASAASGAACVSVRHRIGQPIGPRTMPRRRATTFSGYLMPRHSPGTHPVRINRYLYVAGAWKYSGYSVAVATHSASGDRYSARVALPAPGKWRLRAYAPSDDAHAAAWSRGYTSVTVK